MNSSSLLKLFIHVMSIFCISGNYFRRISGYYIKQYTYEKTVSVLTGRIRCCDYCVSMTTCVSVSYNKISGSCRLSPLSPYDECFVEQHADWEIFYRNDVMIDGSWTLVFRGLSGNNVDMFDSWNNVVSNCLFPYDGTCQNHYRSNLIDEWDKLNIQQVKIKLYKACVDVTEIIFDGFNTTKMSWLAADKLVSSSWNDLLSNGTFNFFSIEGGDVYRVFQGGEVIKARHPLSRDLRWHAFIVSPIPVSVKYRRQLRYGSRTFYINQNHGGCPNDFGWLMVIDVFGTVHPCTYDYIHGRPFILYAKNGAGARWENLDNGFADTINIYIKRQ